MKSSGQKGKGSSDGGGFRVPQWDYVGSALITTEYGRAVLVSLAQWQFNQVDVDVVKTAIGC